MFTTLESLRTENDSLKKENSAVRTDNHDLRQEVRDLLEMIKHQKDISDKKKIKPQGQVFKGISSKTKDSKLINSCFYFIRSSSDLLKMFINKSIDQPPENHQFQILRGHKEVFNFDVKKKIYSQPLSTQLLGINIFFLMNNGSKDLIFISDPHRSI